MTSRRARVRAVILFLGAAACVNLAAGAVLALRDPLRATDLWGMYDWCRGWLIGGERLYTMRDAATDYPPNAVVMLSPLMRLPRAWILPLWTAVALALAPTLAYVVTRCASRGDRSTLIVPMLLFLCWTSTRTLLQFSALSMTLAFASLLIVDSHRAVSGVLLGLALFKPHIAGPIALWVAITGRIRVAVVAALVVAAGWGAYDARVGEGPLTTLAGYWRVLGEMYAGRDGLMGRTSLRAWTHAMAGETVAADAWWIAVSLLLLMAACWLARRDVRRPLDAGGLAAPALLCLWSLLAIYHNTNNLILTLPAFAFLWFLDEARASPSRWAPLLVLQAVMMFDVPTRLDAFAPPGGWIAAAVDGFDRAVVAAVFVYVAVIWYRLTRTPTAG
jgi:hypothetical protein